MAVPDYTDQQLHDALVGLGNFRVKRMQELLVPHHIHAAVGLAIGLRETGLRNVCGGAVLVGGRWVASKTDRGFLQFSDQFPENRRWLASVPGCKEGSWTPDGDLDALVASHCPRFTDAVARLITEFDESRAFADDHGVKHWEQFCVAAHNAGMGGALDGFRRGNLDLHTAQGDYSAWTMRHAWRIQDWIHQHPGWDAKVGSV